MSGLRLLADDLTGSLDSAAAFCGARATVAVFLDAPADRPDAALDLACRDGSEAQAVARVVLAASFLDGAEIAYLKIDSLLRGHWAAILAALWRGGGFSRCVFAPAFPAQRRITRNGRQLAPDAEGVLRPLAIDPAAALAAQGVPVAPMPAAPMPAALGAGGVLLGNAETQDDLRGLVTGWAALPGRVLWCGSAGLAAALAAAPVPRIAALASPILALVGSCHPVSEGQVAHLAATTGWAPLALSGDPAERGLVAAQWGRAGFCLVRAALAPDTPPPVAAARIADCLDRLLPALAPPATLVVVGGETLRAVCRSLGVARIDVEGEVAPGIPVSVLRGGHWHGVRLVSKSGAFGSVEALTHLLGGSQLVAAAARGTRR